MFGRLPAMKNASQSVICRRYFEATCLKPAFFFPNRPISENLIFILEPLPKHFISFGNSQNQPASSQLTVGTPRSLILALTVLLNNVHCNLFMRNSWSTLQKSFGFFVPSNPNIIFGSRQLYYLEEDFLQLCM
jgi:hypothetical protein